MEQAGWIPPDRHQPASCVLIEARQRLQQSQCVGMAGMAEHVEHLAGLRHPAGVHDGDPIGHPGDDPEVMGDQKDGRTGGVLNPLEQFEDLGLDGHVEGGGRLVGNEHIGVVGDGHGGHGPLEHPAGELVGELAGPFGGVGDAHQVEHLRGLGHGRVPANARLVDLDGLGDLEPDGQDRVERRHRILEDHGDVVAAESPALWLGHADQLGAPIADRPADLGAGRKESHHRQERHRLARPRLTDDAQNLAGVHREAHTPHSLHRPVRRPERDLQVGHLEQGSVHGPVALYVCHARTRICWGSKASRSPSPMKLMARQNSTMNIPGG